MKDEKIENNYQVLTYEAAFMKSVCPELLIFDVSKVVVVEATSSFISLHVEMLTYIHYKKLANGKRKKAKGT